MMGNTRGCEPLRVWNRLEPRSRQNDFSRALRAEIHDPLWLLARQWQFGEFKGEDTGSPVLAKLALRTARLASFRNRKPGGFQSYSDALPLEARVEREPVPVDPARRAQLGRQWLTILSQRASQGTLTPVFDAASYRTRFVTRFPLVAPDVTGSTAADVVTRARQESNSRLRQYQSALAGRVVDGVALLAALPAVIVWDNLPNSITQDVPVGHRAMLVAALDDFRAWVASVWSEPTSGEDTAWSDPQLEYQFQCQVPRPGGGSLTLRSDEYASGRLDWYSFDLGPESLPAGGATPGITTEVFTVIPTPAEYPGQPNPRFWEFEDGAVDLGNIRADTTDLAKILLSQFALVYGNNWFVVPCRQAVGTLAEVEGIVVIDVFGQRSLVKPANPSRSTSWQRWDLFSLERHGHDTTTGIGAHLFLPPAVHATLESEAIEAVRLVRDEMANTVWAVEHRIADGLGRGRDGHDAARRFAESIRRQEPVSAAPPGADPEARLRYTLGNSVPENWIPFIPIKKTIDGDDRSIRLQRASMPRFFQNTVRPVRPTTRILRPGLADNDSQALPLFINEEEVSRAGVQVETTFQRSRWFNGATTVWYGRRVRSGRGAGSSGLRFDTLRDIE